MKIRPVILCGGAGTRLWPNQKNHQAKQFIDFGGWTLIKKTLERIKNPIFDYPIISTNLKYLSEVRQSLIKSRINITIFLSMNPIYSIQPSHIANFCKHFIAMPFF